MRDSEGDPIGIIRKEELRDTLQACAFGMRKNPEALEALTMVAIAHGLGECVDFTQFLVHQVEGQVKRLEGGDNGK